MKLFNLFKLLIVLAIFTVAVSYNAEAQKLQKLPNRPYFRGFFYCFDMLDYSQLLKSNMPYEILKGYVIADSAVRMAPPVSELYDEVEKLNVFSDTAQCILKYWYLLNEYDPLRFFSFVSMKKHPGVTTNTNVQMLHSAMRGRMSFNPKSTYVASDYILHVYVNKTVKVDVEDERSPNDGNTGTIAYCKILEFAKGKTFPSIDSALFYNGTVDNAGEEIISEAISTPAQTDVVFSYRDQWDRYNGKPLFDANGDDWIKPNREYIVFLEFWGMDEIGGWDPIGSEHKIYYQLSPYPLPGSYSMYPVEDGYVIDEKNALGFGEMVPVDVFKERICEQISNIKNCDCGE